MIEGLLVGLAIGIPVGLLIARLRGPERPTPTILNALARPASGDSAEGAEADRHDHRLHIRREIVKRRIETRLSPDGLTIKVDDQEFDRLADIPDPVLAAEVRDLLAKLADSVTDPKTRAAIEQELRQAGVEPSS